MPPVNDLVVRLVLFVGSVGERGPADKTFKHDRPDAPPVATVIVALHLENFWRDVVGRTNSRVCQLSAVLTPRVDLTPVADSQLDLVSRDGVAVGILPSCHQLFVVRSVVLLVETGRKSKIGQFDMTATVQQDVVGLDITVLVSTNERGNRCCPNKRTDE